MDGDRRENSLCAGASRSAEEIRHLQPILPDNIRVEAHVTFHAPGAPAEAASYFVLSVGPPE
jgi:hypothetical protein